jgi:hypothetical protein
MVSGREGHHGAVSRWAVPIVWLLTVGAMTSGLAPAALVLGSPTTLAFVVLGSGVTALATLRKGLAVSWLPSRREILVAGVNAAWLPAFLGGLWIVADVGLSLVLRLVAPWVGWDSTSITPDRVGSGVSLTLLAVVGTLLAWFTAGDLAEGLFASSGTGGRHQPVADDGSLVVRTVVLCVLTMVIAGAFLAIGYDRGWWWLVPLVAVFFVGLWLEPAAVAKPHFDRADPDVVQLVGHSLTGRQGDFIAYPQTGEAMVDAFLSLVDVYTEVDDRPIVVEIKQMRPDLEPLAWTDATSVVEASAALSEYLSGDRAVPVTPLLVILDGAPADSMRTFCQGEGVLLACFDRVAGTSEVLPHDELLTSFADRFLNRPTAKAKGRRRAIRRKGVTS